MLAVITFLDLFNNIFAIFGQGFCDIQNIQNGAIRFTKLQVKADH